MKFYACTEGDIPFLVAFHISCVRADRSLNYHSSCYIPKYETENVVKCTNRTNYIHVDEFDTYQLYILCISVTIVYICMSLIKISKRALRVYDV